MAKADTAERLDKALNFLKDSRRELGEGKVVVMEGFQNEVKDICAGIAKLPLEEMRKYSQKLEELSTTLALLEKELRAEQTSVQQEIFKLNRKQSALKSYQIVSHSHKPKKPEEQQ